MTIFVFLISFYLTRFLKIAYERIFIDSIFSATHASLKITVKIYLYPYIHAVRSTSS